MIYLLPHIFFTIFTASAGASSTTDLPAPETTSESSPIAHAYQAYITDCGQLFQGEKDAAFDEYKQSNPSATDPTSPDFLSWAYASYPPYRAGWAGCADSESRYKNLLATFIPDTPSATASQATGTTTPSTTTGTNQGGSTRPERRCNMEMQPQPWEYHGGRPLSSSDFEWNRNGAQDSSRSIHRDQRQQKGKVSAILTDAKMKQQQDGATEIRMVASFVETRMVPVRKRGIG
ncbi:hypothetical protein C8R44DRAFT_734576 [Mycena epipterygia]|nr:hypothetical protein C8R44DRAFT_734576 [Mycena epipterygia]